MLFSGARGFAQSENVTIQLQNVPLKQVMTEIEKQTPFLFLSKRDVNIEKQVSVDVVSRPLSEALAQMAKAAGVSYQIDGKYISLSPVSNEPAHVKGVVLDSDGQPVIGASVIVKGTTIGVSTGVDGSFALTVPAPAAEAVLEVNYLGYEPRS